jgi:hypothetical protein
MNSRSVTGSERSPVRLALINDSCFYPKHRWSRGSQGTRQ